MKKKNTNKHLTICCLTNFSHKDTENKGWKKIFHANEKQKKAEIAIIVSGKINFKQKTIVRDRSLYNNKGINPTRGNNICKYLGT